MKKALLLVAFLCCITRLVLAEDAGNKICPISGKEIDPATAGSVEYKGKTYHLCCQMCDKDFLADPEAAIQKLQEMEELETQHLPTPRSGS